MNGNGDFDEYDLFESEYADELEILDELEGKPNQQESPEEHPALPDLKRDITNSKRKLTSILKDENVLCSSYEDLESLLVIDEGTESLPQPKKLCRGDGFKQLKKLNLPTTLDADRDLKLQRLEEQKRKMCLGTPQIMEKICRYRKNRNESKEFLADDGIKNGAKRSLNFQLTKVLIHPPVHSDFVSATSSDGQRVYMRLKNDQEHSQTLSASALMSNCKISRLLPQTMTELRQVIFEEKQHDVIAESKRITEEIRSHVLFNDSSLSVDANTSVEDVDEGIYSSEDNSNDGLWVNKYAPTHYTHLLSDESVNRALLSWLKLWDKVVFGREYRPFKSKSIEQEQKEMKFKKKFGKTSNKDGFDEELDETKRPKLKAALLCGPPGLGKTTLAHVIAKHAGYHVVEMNASDDRSVEAFKRKLEQTTEMKSVLGSDHKPNCLIIDEIDGTPQAAVNVLLNAMNRGRNKEISKKKKKKDLNSFLQRPVICICNDLYVPSLRLLRQQSLVLQFPPTASMRLTSRLKQVCFLQRLDCDVSSLFALCEKSGNDIRTCVNTLQFVQSKGEKKISLETIKNLSVGQKDQHKSIFYVWGELFQQPKNKRKIDLNVQNVQQSLKDVHRLTQFSARFYHILNIVTTTGEYEKTLQGVFENFLLMKFKDPGMLALNKGCEWLLLYDQLSQHTLSHQEWILTRYLPYLFVTFHLLFSCLSPPRVQFPQKVQENKLKSQKSENLLSTMYADMVPTARCFVSPNVAVLDLVPYLTAIMTPNLRSANKHLYSAVEKRLLSDLVSTMLSYNLTYRQERNQEGQYSYVLEPNMRDVCDFVEEGSGAKRQLSYAIKQIISKEVEMERMRRSEQMMTEKKGRIGKEIGGSDVRKEKKDVKDTTNSGKHIPNHLQRLDTSMKAVTMLPDKPVVNFFKQFTKIKQVDQNCAEKAPKKMVQIRDPGIGNSQLWYKYNEGFSNAVRRTVYVKDFL